MGKKKPSEKKAPKGDVYERFRQKVSPGYKIHDLKGIQNKNVKKRWHQLVTEGT